DATGTGTKTFTLTSLTVADGTHATATFHYTNDTPQDSTLATGAPLVLGDILATVPNSAGTVYKAKELLQLSGITITGTGAVPAVGQSAVHLDAYFGDVTGNGTVDGADALTAKR